MGYVMQVHCPGDDPHDVTVVDHVKLFRNLPELRFEFRIHEQILPAIRRANGEVAFTDIYVVHSGSDRTRSGQAGKLERDFKLLNLELADRPDHPFVLFNLGMTHADCRQFDEAIHFLVRCIEVSGSEESHVRKTYALLISSLMQSGQYERADMACREGRSIFPDDKELLFRQAMLQHQQGRLADAVSTYQQVLSVDGDRHFTSIDAGLSSFKARHNLALVYEDAGDYARAVDEWRRITETEKHYVQGWQGLIEALLKIGDTVQVDRVCGRLRQESTPALRSIAAYGHGRVSELQGETDTALTAFAEAERLDSTDTHALRQSCRILFESGRWDEVERHLERLIEKASEDASAFHNLGIARWQTGHYEPAIAAFRESLRLRPDSLATWEQLGLRLTECGRHSEAAHCRDQVDRLSRSMTQPTEVLTEA